MLLYFLLCLLALLLIIHFSFENTRSRKLSGQIKGPKRMFFFDNTWDLFCTPEQLFRKFIAWRQESGGMFKLMSFTYTAVFLYNVEDIAKILSSNHFNDKKIPYICLYSWLGQGLITSTGKHWQQRRKMLTPAFHFRALKFYFPIICDQTENFIEQVDAEVAKDRTEVMPLINKQTFKIIYETSIGRDTTENKLNSNIDKYVDSLHLLIKCILYRIARTWLLNDFIYSLTSTSRTEKKMVIELHKFSTTAIQERRIFRDSNNISVVYNDDETFGKDNKLSLMDLLLDEEKKGHIDEVGIREEIDTFTFAGYDTTATALTFMIMKIANEPEIQNSIYQELQTIFEGSQRTPTFKDLTQMKYLECCIKESLRMYPSVPVIARYINDETELGGYTIPKHTICFINIFDIHRNPNLYPDPEKFIPERFQPQNVSKIHPYAYIPFSAGHRNCIGQKFAMIVMKTIMSSLLWRFKLEPVTKPDDIIFESSLMLKSTQPIYARFLRRNV